MTSINKPESESSARDEHAFDGITFEVEEEEHTQEGQKVKRRGIYLWPNLITTAALLSGFYSIIASMNGDFTHAIYAIFLAALLDGLDGRVARAIGACLGGRWCERARSRASPEIDDPWDTVF